MLAHYLLLLTFDLISAIVGYPEGSSGEERVEIIISKDLLLISTTSFGGKMFFEGKTMKQQFGFVLGVRPPNEIQAAASWGGGGLPSRASRLEEGKMVVWSDGSYDVMDVVGEPRQATLLQETMEVSCDCGFKVRSVEPALHAGELVGCPKCGHRLVLTPAEL